MKRFERWLNKAPPQTRALGTLLVEKVVPEILRAGFQSVTAHFAEKGSQVQGGEIVFERVSSDFVDCINLFFDKYASPRFQISFSRRSRADVRQFVRSGRLVKKPTQYYFEWGKPRWMPMALWSTSQSRTVVDQVSNGIHQVLRFLDSGIRGPAISKELS